MLACSHRHKYSALRLSTLIYLPRLNNQRPSGTALSIPGIPVPSILVLAQAKPTRSSQLPCATRCLRANTNSKFLRNENIDCTTPNQFTPAQMELIDALWEEQGPFLKNGNINKRMILSVVTRCPGSALGKVFLYKL